MKCLLLGKGGREAVLAVVHNGNLINAVELKKELEDQGAIFTTTKT